jgi:type IV pilus assembly protein PilV
MTLRTRGFTLVESLVALLLLSVGLLGAGILLVSGLRSHSDALRQVAATNLARDMADRIRANPRGRGDYDTRTSAPDAAACDPALPCEPARRAAFDIAFFLERAQLLFPGVDTVASIQFEPAIGPAAPERYAITLRWRGPRDDIPLSAVTLQLLAPPVAG